MLSHNYELVSRNNYLVSRNYELVSHNYDLVSRNYELISRYYELSLFFDNHVFIIILITNYNCFIKRIKYFIFFQMRPSQAFVEVSREVKLRVYSSPVINLPQLFSAKFKKKIG